MSRMTLRKVLSLMVVLSMLLMTIAACGGAPAAPAAPADEAAAPADAAAGADAAAMEGTSAERALAAATELCSGVNINAVWESGLQPQDPLTTKVAFEEATGATVTVVELPYVDLYTKQLADAQTGGGAYDVITLAPSWLIDFVNTGVVEPLNQYVDKYMAPGDMEDYLGPYGAEGYARMGETWYGLPDDGDVFIMYYRTDLFEDQANKDAFQAKFGRELTVPATQAEFEEVGSFFTEQLGPDVYGGAYQHMAGQAFDWFIGPFAGAGGAWFDPDTMDATLNSDAGVQVLTSMVNATKWMPPGVQTWGFTEVLSAWLDGKAAMIITWPPIGRWSNGIGKGTEQLSWVPETKVAGKVGYAPEPGGRSALAGGFALGVSPNSANKECAYLFAQWMNSPSISLDRVMLPFALRDPFRSSHFTSDAYNGMWDTAPDYLKSLETAALAGINELGIPGAREYMDALDQAVTSAYAGTDPKQALDAAAVKFNEITDRLGRDAQKEAYAQWLLSPWSQTGPK